MARRTTNDGCATDDSMHGRCVWGDMDVTKYLLMFPVRSVVKVTVKILSRALYSDYFTELSSGYTKAARIIP